MTETTLLYRFDDPAAFPVLESETTATGPVSVHVEGHGTETFLWIAAERAGNDPPGAKVVLALPPREIAGSPEMVQLSVLGDASGCAVFLEAADANGWGFAYAFEPIDFRGWRTLEVEVQRPAERFGDHDSDVATSLIEAPVQPSRLGIRLGPSLHRTEIGLATLSVTGNVRLVRPGIA